MARCPKCGEALSYLRQSHEVCEYYEFGLNEDGKPYYEHVDTEPSQDSGAYECPGCYVELAYNEQDAIALLKGEGINEKMAEYYMKLALEGKD